MKAFTLGVVQRRAESKKSMQNRMGAVLLAQKTLASLFGLLLFLVLA